uniref:Uncharacterized protein n=1 Tax=Oryza punctata TaxID=4537 RepID=A0A0E0KM03_ORYPU
MEFMGMAVSNAVFDPPLPPTPADGFQEEKRRKRGTSSRSPPTGSPTIAHALRYSARRYARPPMSLGYA